MLLKSWFCFSVKFPQFLPFFSTIKKSTFSHGGKTWSFQNFFFLGSGGRRYTRPEPASSAGGHGGGPRHSRLDPLRRTQPGAGGPAAGGQHWRLALPRWRHRQGRRERGGYAGAAGAPALQGWKSHKDNYGENLSAVESQSWGFLLVYRFLNP